MIQCENQIALSYSYVLQYFRGAASPATSKLRNKVDCREANKGCSVAGARLIYTSYGTVMIIGMVGGVVVVDLHATSVFE